MTLQKHGTADRRMRRNAKIGGPAEATDDLIPKRERRGGARLRAQDRDPDDRQFINSLSRGLQVLAAISDVADGLTNHDIAVRVDLPGPTISRITHTLTSLGYLAHGAATGRYRLGGAVLPFWRGYFESMKVVEVASAHMREFALQTRSTVALGTQDRGQIVYLDVQRQVSMMFLAQEVGSRMPLERSAAGWAWLSAASPAARAAALAQVERNPAVDLPYWLPKIEAAHEMIQRVGFCAIFGEWQPEINGVAAPLQSPDGTTLLTVGCGGPAFAFDRARMCDDIGPRIAALARAVRQDAIARGIW